MTNKQQYLGFRPVITQIVLPMLILSIAQSVCASASASELNSKTAEVHISHVASQSSDSHLHPQAALSDSCVTCKISELNNKGVSAKSQSITGHNDSIINSDIPANDNLSTNAKASPSQFPQHNSLFSLFAQKTSLLIYQV